VANFYIKKQSDECLFKIQAASKVARRNNFVIYILLSATLMPVTEVNRVVPLQQRIWLDV